MICSSCQAPLPANHRACSQCGTVVVAKRIVPPPRTRKSKSGALQRVAFNGNGMGLLMIHLKNMILMPLTLGIYYFWGKVDVLRYLYAQTEFAGERFQFHGTGMERFKGALRVMAVVVGIAIAIAALNIATQGAAKAATTMLLYVFWALVLPYAIFASRRYRLSRTSLQGIRFSYRGDLREFYQLCLKGGLLSVVTLGLYLPFLMHHVRAYQIRNTRYGTSDFTFEGTGAGMLRHHITGYFASLFTFGIYSFWHQAFLERYFWENTTFQGARFRSTISGAGLFGLFLTNALLVTLTLGLGLPWAQVRTVRYKLGQLSLEGTIDLAAIRQDAMHAGAVGDEMADMLGLEVGI